MFYGILTISSYNNTVVERESATQEYQYDVTLSHLDEKQFIALKDKKGGSGMKIDDYFTMEPNSIDSYYTEGGDKYYDVRITFIEGGADEWLPRFNAQYYTPGGEPVTLNTVSQNVFYYSVTPRANINANIAVNQAGYWALSALILGLSIFLMTSLYNIRVNQYKFTYGVYMTYGADFKKLFGTAFWEMFMISVITFIPSVVLSTVVVYFMYAPSGFPFAFNPMVFLQVFIFSLIVVLVSVFFPMRIMSIRQPMGLIVTQDNSNLVISPKHSINVFKKKFPTKYEMYSAWRFRKYSVTLLATAIVFCVFFIMGLYLADIYTTDIEYKRPDFTIDLTNSQIPYDDMMSEQLYGIEGIEAIQVTGNSTEANKISTHILVHKSGVKFLAADMVNYKGEDYDGKGMKATNNVDFNAMTEEQLRVLDEFYTIEGDTSKLFADDGKNYIIVGDSLSNIVSFKYKVGDTIQIPTYDKIKTKGIDGNYTGTALLREQIKRFTFGEYKEYTICAIITDIPSGNLPIYLNNEDYKTVTGSDPDAYFLNVYIDRDYIDAAEDKSAALAKVDSDLRAWSHSDEADLESVNITNSFQISKNSVAYDKHNNELYIVISILLLGISPVMWFFSQTLYYLKRESEFNILQALGAKVSEIRQIYLQGGLLMAGLSLVVSFVLSFLGSYALFYLYNVLMPYFTHENVRYAFYMPWYALVTSVVVSVACGFLSAYLPYKSYYKNRFTLENGGGGDYDD